MFDRSLYKSQHDEIGSTLGDTFDEPVGFEEGKSLGEELGRALRVPVGEPYGFGCEDDSPLRFTLGLILDDACDKARWL